MRKQILVLAFCGFLLCGCGDMLVAELEKEQLVQDEIVTGDSVVSEQAVQDDYTLKLAEAVNEKKKKEPPKEHKGVDLNVDIKKADNMIKLVLAPDFFGVNQDDEDIKKEVRSWGAKNVSINEDGFVSAYMSPEEYDEYVLKLKKKLEDTVDNIVKDKKKYPHVFSIEANETFTDFIVKCDPDIAAEKAITAFDIYVDSATYQVFSGISPKEARVNITYLNKDNGEVIDKIDTEQLVRK